MKDQNTTNETISILTHVHEEATGTDPSKRSMFPKPSANLLEYAEIPAEQLANNLEKFMNSLQTVVKKIPSTVGDYDVDEITFSLSINGSGKVSLVAELAAGFSSGIEVKIKKT